MCKRPFADDSPWATECVSPSDGLGEWVKKHELGSANDVVWGTTRDRRGEGGGMLVTKREQLCASDWLQTNTCGRQSGFDQVQPMARW